MIAAIGEAIGHRYWLRPLPEIDTDTELDDLGADSLDRVTIAMALDERFGFEICSRELTRWANVADIIATVEGGGRANHLS